MTGQRKAPTLTSQKLKAKTPANEVALIMRMARVMKDYEDAEIDRDGERRQNAGLDLKVVSRLRKAGL